MRHWRAADVAVPEALELTGGRVEWVEAEVKENRASHLARLESFVAGPSVVQGAADGGLEQGTDLVSRVATELQVAEEGPGRRGLVCAVRAQSEDPKDLAMNHTRKEAGGWQECGGM